MRCSMMKGFITMTALFTGYWGAEHAVRTPTVPFSPIAQPFHIAGKTLAEHMLINKQVCPLLQLHRKPGSEGEEKPFMDAEYLAERDSNGSAQLTDVPKIFTRFCLASVGGLSYLFAKGLDKSAEIYNIALNHFKS